MRASFAPLALAALAVANPMPQGVTSAIAPEESAPAGCSADYSGKFEIQTVNATNAKRDLNKRASDPLIMTLEGGVLTDAKDRTGYIAANEQFQFDGPPQTGAIYTAGWSICGNGSLAIGGSAVFYECLSGTFYNLYDENVAAQCTPIYIQAVPMGAASTVASQITDGQVTATPVASPVCELSDGQPQQTDCNPVSQITDGQIQAPTSTANAVSQITDGQIQAPTSTAVVSQITDGQIQAPTTASAGYTMPSASSNGTVASATPSQSFTGGAMPTAIRGEFFGLAAGVLAVALL